MIEIAPIWHWGLWVGDFATVWKIALGHWEGHQESCNWFTCLWSGPTCIQLIKGVFIADNLRKSLSPLLWVLEYHIRCISYFLPKAIMPLARTKNRIFLPTLPLPLLTTIPRVGFRFNHICILPCLYGVMYKFLSKSWAISTNGVSRITKSY